MKKTVSIIIPVYNSEPYLPRCLDSVLAQTYSEIEVLLIDDGSTDNSYSLCQQYAQSDSRVKVIHQDNQGASAARNTGLDNATGDYIMFCDSDDMVSAKWVEHLVRYVLEQPDIIMPFSFICSDMIALGSKIDRNVKQNVFFNISQLYTENVISLIGLDVNTLFYRLIIQSNHLRFRSQKDKADYNEDVLFVTSYIQYVDRFIYCGYADYIYCTREDSLSRTYSVYYFEKYEEKFDINYKLCLKYGTDHYLNGIANEFLYHFLISYKQAILSNDYKRFERIVTSSSVQECVYYASVQNEDPREIKMLKKKQVLRLWLYNRFLNRFK